MWVRASASFLWMKVNELHIAWPLSFICDCTTYVKLKRGTKQFWLNNWHRSIGISCAILGWKAAATDSIPMQCNAWQWQKSIASISQLFFLCHSFNSFWLDFFGFKWASVCVYSSLNELTALCLLRLICLFLLLFTFCFFLSDFLVRNVLDLYSIQRNAK